MIEVGWLRHVVRSGWKVVASRAERVADRGCMCRLLEDRDGESEIEGGRLLMGRLRREESEVVVNDRDGRESVSVCGLGS